ncbi:MAG TPA: lysylphosphatidylglycerol synthase transmembrane domain-containing protein [Planctomycetota bacterium]|nr:lysylphosphatidylglycerol synthase transmembrane domain-containing protein [Planctomycetota bacterium]
MSPSARRRAVGVLRLAVTAAALVVVGRWIDFRDQIAVRADDGSWIPDRARDVRVEGDRVRVVGSDGRVHERAAAEVRVLRPGFFSLFRLADKRLFAAMLAALLVPLVFLALRWWILLRAHGFEVGPGRTFLVTYAGFFFNNFLPGSVGGDLTKMMLVASGEDRKAAVVGTVLLDRLIGFGVMVLLAAACLTPFLGRFAESAVGWWIYGLAGAMAVGYVVYFNPTLRGFLRRRLPLEGVLRELDGVFRSVKERRGLVLAAAGLSALAQGSTILIVYGLARALRIENAALWQFFVFEPIIFIVSSLPVSVGGWGVQELAYAELFGRLGGMDPGYAVALSVLYKLSLILVSIPGGLLFAAGATRRRGPGGV